MKQDVAAAKALIEPRITSDKPTFDEQQVTGVKASAPPILTEPSQGILFRLPNGDRSLPKRRTIPGRVEHRHLT